MNATAPHPDDGTDDPLVSVIVPVFDDRARLQLCLDALMVQTYRQDRLEVIIVDNGSTDGSAESVSRYPVTLLHEDEVQSSYAARNRGLESARGSVLAFTDSDCIPDPDWVGNGVRTLNEAAADLVGGQVRFAFSDNPTGAELFDSISNMQNEINIRERNVAKTANLFVRAEVFGRVGPYPGDVKSGGDVSWTGRATTAGYRLVYGEQAVVAHPARKLLALMRKQYRVGTGQPTKGPASQRSTLGILRSAAGGVRRTQSADHIRARLEEQGNSVSRSDVVRAWGAGFAVRVAMAAGNVATLIPTRRLAP
jgi:hypothetical protein